MVTSTYLPHVGGIEYHINGLSNALINKHNISVDIAVISLKNNIYSTYEEQSMSIFNIPTKGIFPFLYFHNLSTYIQGFNYDIIHIHDPQVAGISAHFMLNNYKIPLILATHGGMFHTNKKSWYKNLYWNIITKNLIKQYSKVVSVSKNDYKTFKQIVAPDKLTLIENGIDFNKFFAHNFKIAEKNNWRFIYFGRFSSNKQVHLLIELFLELSKKHPYIKLQLIGGTDDEDYIKLLFEMISLSPNITITPFMEDSHLISELHNADFFITASAYEGFGMSVIESMSAGLIPIVNDILPLNELVTDQENGFILNIENLAESIRKLNSILTIDSATYNVIKTNALLMAERYSWDHVSQSYSNLYWNLINEK